MDMLNRITTNRRCITQLLDRAPRCQPLLADPWKKQCDPVGGRSPCLGCGLSESTGVFPAQVPFQEECGDGEEVAHGRFVDSYSNMAEQRMPQIA
ncbi:hypothetical protein QA943_36815 [Streptomyces sp. B21-097]|uniref:hypothetical protein n=1 Tax=Streptomyces sp. B21-097 TaxID=3039414 RepID=UPI002FEEF3F1